MAAWNDGSTAAERCTLPTDVELDGRAFWTKVIGVPCRLEVQWIVEGLRPCLYYQDAQGWISRGQPAGKDQSTGATCGSRVNQETGVVVAWNGRTAGNNNVERVFRHRVRTKEALETEGGEGVETLIVERGFIWAIRLGSVLPMEEGA